MSGDSIRGRRRNAAARSGCGRVNADDGVQVNECAL